MIRAGGGWAGPVAVVIAGLLFLLEITRPGGAAEAALGAHAWPFWIGVGFWIVVSASALRRRQFLWVAVSAPVILYPIVVGGVLFAACLNGNCL